MGEIWKSLNGLIECGDYYEVSNLGNIRSIDRMIEYSNGMVRFHRGKMLKKRKDKDGYLITTLLNGQKRNDQKIHRLVAIAFIPNPNNLPCINHIDECKENNSSYNLEWCDHRYNNNYGTHNEKVSKSKMKRVKVFKYETMEFLGEFDSQTLAGEFAGVTQQSVSDVCRKKRKKVKGYYFEYAK